MRPSRPTPLALGGCFVGFAIGVGLAPLAVAYLMPSAAAPG
ncbi:unnamed protein product [Gemmataceae bacterium]|nr:unnamed protein product [Gemmataceae bacterium]VTU01815.1 unnamed protein product [Gemmataceae bacterium]